MFSAIVGLGNPGPRYSDTRHNAGFWFVDRVAARLGAPFSSDKKLDGDIAVIGTGDDRLFLFKPATFMNASGGPVGKFLRYYRLKPLNTLVAYDELDLEPGIVRLKIGGGHGGHNGLRDIFSHLESPDFGRIRLGIGHPGHKDRVTPWVLGRPPASDETAIGNAIEAVIDELPGIRGTGWDKAVMAIHSRPAT